MSAFLNEARRVVVVHDAEHIVDTILEHAGLARPDFEQEVYDFTDSEQISLEESSQLHDAVQRAHVVLLQLSRAGMSGTDIAQQALLKDPVEEKDALWFNDDYTLWEGPTEIFITPDEPAAEFWNAITELKIEQMDPEDLVGSAEARIGRRLTGQQRTDLLSLATQEIEHAKSLIKE